RARPRRADQPPGPRVDRRPRRRAGEVRGDRLRGDPRPRPHRAVRDPAVGLHPRGAGRLPRDLRRVPGEDGLGRRGHPGRRGERQATLRRAMDFLATARRLEAIQAEATRDLASDSEPVAGGWMAANGPGSFLNKTVGMGFESEPTPEDIVRVERFFASRGIEPRIELTAFASIGFLRKVAEAGFVLQEFEHTLVRPIDAVGIQTRLEMGWPEGVRLEPIDPADADQVHAFVLTSASGFIPEGERISETLLQTGLKAARAPDHIGFMAYADGEIAGAAGSSYRRGVISLLDRK